MATDIIREYIGGEEQTQDIWNQIEYKKPEVYDF